jgi:carboxysome shell carbonic anhydrase
MIRPFQPPWRNRPSNARLYRPYTARTQSAQIDASPLASESPRVVHVLADTVLSRRLRERANEIELAFREIEPVLRELGPLQFESDFSTVANATISARLGFTLPPKSFAATWAAPLDMSRLYARCVLRTFRRLVERAFDRDLARCSEGEDAPELIRRWGFHAIDITPCADGRLSGVVDYILRVPPAVIVARRSYAGALFDVAESMRHWEAVELRRWRDGQPNAADEPTRFLKIGVYHFSSADPDAEGCAAHGSDGVRAASALLERLEQFATGLERTHGRGGAVATLLVGVDTDTDAIRVHVPDAAGRMDALRYVDNAALYEATCTLPRDAAKAAIREAVAACAGVAADDPSSEGLRWFCGYLLKNNIGQMDAVRAWYGGSYADRGHTERLIVVGDAVDDVQLRNLAFQAQMETVEAGAIDLDVGVRILRKLHEPQGLAVPVLVHFRYDPRIPGSQLQARQRATRLRAAILSRYAQLAAHGSLHVEAVVRAGDATALSGVESADATLAETD